MSIPLINNHRPMTERQRKANNGRVSRMEIAGLNIAIELPRGYLKNAQRLASHYGYIQGTKGADGAQIDCFVGPNMHQTDVFIINHMHDGKFDEHKVFLGFDHPSDAADEYRRVYGKPSKPIRVKIDNFRTWLAGGAKNVPYKQEKEMKRVWWNDQAEPLFGQTMDSVIYDIRLNDPENLMVEPLVMDDVHDDADSVEVFDALVIPFNKLERNMDIMIRQMQRVPTGVKPVSHQISKPFKKNGTSQVAVVFELSDGQTMTIFFHNPDITPTKIQPTDDMVSWKWCLNKKDITIVVAPERGADIKVRDVASRVMRLAEKNSAAFKRRNEKRAEKMEAIEAKKQLLEAKRLELKKITASVEVSEFVELPMGDAWTEGPLLPIVEKREVIADEQAKIEQTGNPEPENDPATTLHVVDEPMPERIVPEQGVGNPAPKTAPVEVEHVAESQPEMVDIRQNTADPTPSKETVVNTPETHMPAVEEHEVNPPVSESTPDTNASENTVGGDAGEGGDEAGVGPVLVRHEATDIQVHVEQPEGQVSADLVWLRNFVAAPINLDDEESTAKLELIAERIEKDGGTDEEKALVEQASEKFMKAIEEAGV